MKNAENFGFLYQIKSKTGECRRSSRLVKTGRYRKHCLLPGVKGFAPKPCGIMLFPRTSAASPIRFFRQPEFRVTRTFLTKGALCLWPGGKAHKESLPAQEFRTRRAHHLVEMKIGGPKPSDTTRGFRQPETNASACLLKNGRFYKPGLTCVVYSKTFNSSSTST